MPYVPNELKTTSFIAGKAELYNELCSNPELRLVPINKLYTIKDSLYKLGYKFRVRYRGPHSRSGETLKRNAYAFVERSRRKGNYSRFKYHWENEKRGRKPLSLVEKARKKIQEFVELFEKVED